MKTLTLLPNIGKTLEDKLNNVGVHTPDDLKKIGSENALIKIRTVDQSACFNMLCALEGAIQGIRWHNLPDERKEELKEFLKIRGIPLSVQ